LVADLTAALRECGNGEAALPIRQYGRRVLTKRYRQFEREADNVTLDSEPALYHAARIRVKRLRYTVDALTAVYGRRAGELVIELKALQDLLGEHQDCAVAIEWLRQTALSDRKWPALTLVRTGELMEQRRHHMAELREAWPSALEAVEKRWRPLRRATRKAARSGDGALELKAEAAAVAPPEPRPLSFFQRFFGRAD
jgi:CHAD domain-containing protein